MTSSKKYETKNVKFSYFTLIAETFANFPLILYAMKILNVNFGICESLFKKNLLNFLRLKEAFSFFLICI